MVCGMGGSSLCPEVLGENVWTSKTGFPELLVLDSTDPDVIAALARTDRHRALSFRDCFKVRKHDRAECFLQVLVRRSKQAPRNPGENFIAITDPGSPLVETATELGFQRTFLNQPDIGGRYSALSYFGMVPAALMGLDIRTLLDGARQLQSMSENTALQLGAILGECANAGRDKLTLVIDPSARDPGLVDRTTDSGKHRQGRQGNTSGQRRIARRP